MGKKKKLGKSRRDKFYRLSKERGYRARSAFKLIQLNKRFDFLNSARVCIDLCAAPGSWMQVCSEYMPVSSLIVGVDLVPIRPIRNCISVVGDITTDKCKVDIEKQLHTWKSDLVIHDGAPNMGSSWEQDAYTQSVLVLNSVKLAAYFLRKDGCFVTKVFRSKDYNSLLYVFRQLFQNTYATKPASSRSESAEIYVVCKNFLAPKKIDPRLFDPRSVFEDFAMPQGQEQIISNFLSTKKASRDGYEDGNYTLFKRGTVAEFVESDIFLELLTVNNEMVFDDASKVFEDSKHTTEEIKELFLDLKLLNKKDVRTLCNWRKKVHDLILPKKEEEQEETGKVHEVQETIVEDSGDELETMEKQVEEMKRKMSAREKKKVKKMRERRVKLLQRTGGLHTQETDDISYFNRDGELFSLEENVGRSEENVGRSEENVGRSEENVGRSEEKGDPENTDQTSEEEIEPDGYIEDIGKQLERDYNEWKERKAVKPEKSTEESEKLPDAEGENDISEDSDSDENSEDSESEEEETGNIRKLQWFNQQEFEGLEDNVAKKRNRDEDIDEDEIKEPETKRSKVEESNDESSESDEKTTTAGMDLDQNTKAEVLALGKKMLRVKDRREIVDSCYNRYAWDDGESMPKWFVDDERAHNKPTKPITKEEVAQIKAQIYELDARPIKKVAEATARKRAKAERHIKKRSSEVSSILEDKEATSREKKRMIDGVMRRTGGRARSGHLYVVARSATKGRKGSSGGRLKIVDRRLKKDTRGQKMQGKNMKKGKRRK